MLPNIKNLFEFLRFSTVHFAYNNYQYYTIVSLYNIKRDMSSITITFGDRAQNHKGMQMLGTAAERGFSIAQLESAKTKFQERGFKCELVNLNQAIKQEADQAKVLLVKRGVDCLLSTTTANGKDLFQELKNLQWDEKAFMYGKVVSKHARHNLCFSNQEQEPDYESGKGRIIPWNAVPLLNALKKNLDYYIPNGSELEAEGNYYYDVKKCGIGFHGDAQRKKVVAIRLCSGKCYPLHYQWFLRGKPIGQRTIVELEDRDLYIMSEKAVGTDWKKKIVPTLRHATGVQKFTKIA